MKNLINYIIVFMLAVFLNLSGPLQAQDTIKIGVIQCITGVAAAYGEKMLFGINQAKDDINTAGGIKGKKIELIIKDSGYSKTQAAAMFKMLAGMPEILAVCGPEGTPTTVAVAHIAEEMKLLSISPMSTSPESFDPNNRWLFRIPLTLTTGNPMLLEKAQEKLGIKNLAIMYAINNDYTVQSQKVFVETAKKLGITVVAVEAFRQGDVDFSGQLTKLRSLNVDALILCAISGDAGLIAAKAREMGIKARFIGDAGITESTYYKVSRGAGDGSIAAIPFNPKDERPIVKRFVQAYQKYYKTTEFPSAPHAYGYDALAILADAIGRAKTLKKEAVRDALGETNNFEGLTGILSYRDHGDVIRTKVYVVEMKGESYEPF